MTELRVVLTLEALNAIAAGDELAFDADTCRVFLSCETGAVIAFHALVQRAMLHLLPVEDTKH